MVAMKHLNLLTGRVDRYSRAHRPRSSVSCGAPSRRVHPESTLQLGTSTLRIGNGTMRSNLGAEFYSPATVVVDGAGNSSARRQPCSPGIRAQLKYLDVAGEYRVPSFTPFSAFRLNPLLAEASRAADEWAVKHFGSTMDPEQFRKLSDANFHGLTGGVFPTASLPRLEWAMEYFMLLYIWDDEVLYKQMESTSKGGVVQHYLELQLLLVSSFPHDPTLQETLEKYLQHQGHPGLHQSTSTQVAEGFGNASVGRQQQGTDIQEAKKSPLCSAFLDLWTKATSKMSDEWSLRFAHIFQRDLYASWIEVQDMGQNIQPSIPSYILRRREMGSVESTLVIVDYVLNVSISNSIYFGSFMQQFVQTTIDVVTWHNDMWSFPKELVDGETYNLVFLISKEKNCSYNEAAEIVNQMVVDRCTEMQCAAAELRDYCKHHELSTSDCNAINQYISCAYGWISSTHAFHSTSSRFRLSKEATLTLPKSCV